MGVDIYLNGGFSGATVSKATVADAIQTLRDKGFEMSSDNRDNHVIKYRSRDRSKDPGSDQYQIRGHSKHADDILDKVEREHLLKIPVYCDSSSFKLGFAFGTPVSNTDMTVQITGPDEWWFDSETEEGRAFLEEHNLLAAEETLQQVYETISDKPEKMVKYEYAPRPDDI